MLKQGFPADFGGTRFLTISFIIVNAFTWYVVVFETLVHILDTTSMTPYEIAVIWTIHFGGVTCAALIGGILANQLLSRNNLLLLWTSLGVVSSLVPMIIGTVFFTRIAVISLLLGVAFGLGMPSCMAYFAEFVVIEKRGRLGGIICFAIGIGTFLLWIVLLPSARLAEQLMILAIWRGCALVPLFVFRQEDRCVKVAKGSSYVAILREKPLLFYLIPWIMFCLVDSLTRPIFPPDIVYMSVIVGSAIAGLFALVGGLFSDLVGRKPVIIAGFIIMGIGYAALGIFPEKLVLYYLFMVMSGIAWGMFEAVFLMTLWGDLAERMACIHAEKYYAIGGLPYLLPAFLHILLAPYIRELIPMSATFSFASLFLFLAIMPLLYAPETLPKKVIEKRRLRKYLEDVKKVKKEHERDSRD